MGTSSPSTGEAQVMTRVPRLGEDEVRTRFTRSKRPTWGHESTGMGEALVANPTHQVKVRSTCRPESPDPGEVQVGTRVSRCR